ncbi:MAG: hypothetical protein HYX76_10125 [Acidobacteria bacterium]|nr:hypothetical protein [Acidobacteriota bacterium]
MRFLEGHNIVEGFPAVDLQTGANNGDYVSLKQYGHVAVVFASGIGTAGDDPTLTLQQATSVAGGSAKALNFTTMFRKQAATSLAAVGAWTKTTQAAANSYTNATAAEEALIWVVEVDAADLDVVSGFDCLRATVADVGGNAQPGYLFYVLSEPRYAATPADMPSAIVD